MSLSQRLLLDPLMRSLKAVLKTADVAVTRHSTLQMLWERSTQLDSSGRARHDLAFLAQMPPDEVGRLFSLFGSSKSQIRQDLFVLSRLDYKRSGYFVEFGATNGVDLSNTHLLEKEFGWTGVLAEPARGWHAALNASRHCHVEQKCVWSTSGRTLSFSQAANADMSTLSSFVQADHHASARAGSASYDVQTISLADLLAKYGAPPVVDYLSIDTEGSEYDILRAFDFDKYRFRVITCEHNHSAMRAPILDLLTANGYKRVLENVSQFDDWFVDDQAGQPSPGH